MSKVRGKNVVVFFYDPDTLIWKQYACALSCSLNLITEILETSVVGSGSWATHRGVRNSFDGSISGLVNLNKANTLSLSDLRAKQILFTQLLMRYQRTDEDGNVYLDEARFIISKSSDEGPDNGMNTFSIDLKGTGSLTPIFTQTPTNSGGKKVKISYYIGAGGENTYQALDYATGLPLIGKEIVGAEKDGVGYKLILSGTPVNKEVLYNSISGNVTFSNPFQQGEIGFLQYQDL